MGPPASAAATGISCTATLQSPCPWCWATREPARWSVWGRGSPRYYPASEVILSFVPACGRCKSCLEGHANLCDNHMATGPFMYDGTRRLHTGDQYIHHMGKVACFADYAVVPETGCVPVSAPIPMDKAAMIDCCVPTGVGAALFSANVQPGSSVAVVGCGGVGLNVIMGAKLVNAAQIIAVDIRESQLEFAMKCGATHLVNASDRDPVAQVKELTGDWAPTTPSRSSAPPTPSEPPTTCAASGAR